ncbi:winged helix-turn-helix domain-containing protein [Geobacter sp. SVR]|uniref:helix-turn-helix domain-containing protein n=1 Tax=Geobacter sp. SVR TaxID=2495594 RepID=UPI00143EFAA8|nr:winged helix-turn-helix domain-containing protein [Geobacter sp. SVR]BCS52647.1 hypothetical protein GSVR_09550 [Geobacter sp. SVR]GCF83915.1 hypothetical protein GSbR_05150 [Geobacter sp. SVR]
MKKIDARKLNPEAQQKLRKRLIRLREKGMSNQLAAQTVGISETRASSIWQLYWKGESDILKVKHRGRKLGEHRLLTPKEERTVQKILLNKTPDQLDLGCNLWTREAIRLTITQEAGVEVSLRAITEYLERWGFTPQMPTKGINKLSRRELLKWRKTEYPSIVDKSQEEGAEIHWLDFDRICIGSKDQIAEAEINTAKGNIYRISSLTNRKTGRFMLYQEEMTISLLRNFLSRLFKDRNRKIFLISYNHHVLHKVLPIRGVGNFTNKYELFCLPSTLPEHNPE